MTKVLTYLLVIFIAVTTPIEFKRIQTVQNHQNDALHSIMCRAETLVVKTPVSSQFTAKQKRQALRFYRSALTHAHLPPCNPGG